MSDTRIYVADLAAYNGGELHGLWIDLDGLDADDIGDAVAVMLRASNFPNVLVPCPSCGGFVAPAYMAADPAFSPCKVCRGSSTVPSAEEWAIHDHEGFGGWDLGEWESFEDVATMAEAIEEHGGAYPAWIGHVGADVDDVDGFEDAYRGEWDSEKAYGEDYAENCVAGLGDRKNEELAMYFDWEAYTRDLFLDGHFSETNPEGGVWVFLSC